MNLVFKGARQSSGAVEDAKQYFRDQATLRLARITNGVHPDYINGSPKGREKGFDKSKRK